MFEKLKGYKTKVIAFVIAGQIVLEALGVPIPKEVIEILIAAGLLTARAPGAEALAKTK